MPLPIKSRYTIAEAANYIATATGENVTQAQILDWGTQGFYKLHLAIERYSIRADGTVEIIQIRDSIIELRLTGGQAAILGRGERVGMSVCWHNGAACKFIRQRTGDYSGWTPDTVYFGAAGLLLLGAELAAFTTNISEPQQTAPATDTVPEQTAATPAPVADGKRREKKPSIESVAFDYMRKEYQSGQFQSAAKFHKYLIKTAGLDKSPFEVGTRTNAGKLFCTDASSFFDVGTLGKLWPKIRAE